MHFAGSRKLKPRSKRIIMVAMLVAGAIVATSTIQADTVTQTAKMFANDGEYRDLLGLSLAVEGSTVVAGVRRASYASYTEAGAAYVFDCSTQPCRQVSKLLASDRTTRARLGDSVAISGTTVVVGTGSTDTIYVYDLATCLSICFESKKLTASDGGEYDAFGFSIEMTGQTVVVGAPYHDHDDKNNAGAAYVFDLATCEAAACTETRKLTISDPAASDYFGWSVAVDGTTAAAGSTGKKAGYVFNLASCGAACTETSKLTNSEATAAFGETVDVSGSTAILGAASAPGGYSFGAYVFDLASCGAACTEVSKLTSSDFQSDDILGYSVAIEGEIAVVGAVSNDDTADKAGSAYVFNVASCGSACTEVTKLLASDREANERFGVAVDVSGTTVAVSASGDNGGYLGKGAVYLFAGKNLSLGDEILADGFED